MRIIKTADFHFGVPGRLRHTLWAARVIREYAHRNGIGVVLHLGDISHDRRLIELDVICTAHDFFKAAKHEYGQNWIMFPGNHDMYLKNSWTINSLKMLGDNATIIEGFKRLRIGGLNFWIVPFINYEKSYLEVIRRIEQQHQEGDVLLTHIGTTGAIKNVCFLLKDWTVVTFENSKFDRIYTGHFHVQQQVGRNVWYPGSPIPYKADEGDCDHGFFVFDTETRTHEFYSIWALGSEYFPDEVPPPNYLTVPAEMLNSDGIAPVLKNNIIRVAIDRDYSQNERQQVNEQLTAQGVTSVRWVDLQSDEVKHQVAASMQQERAGDLFEKWLAADAATITESGLNVELLRSLNADTITEGDSRYEYQDDD